MRDILFRAKLKTTDNQKDGTWIFGSAFYRDNGEYWMMIDEDTATDDFGTGSYCIKYETLTEYIGLKDKNGNRIFEGDIVKSTTFQEKTFQVYFDTDYCGYRLMDANGSSTDFYYHDIKYIEVIGNIYDNLELLKGGVLE